MNVQFIMTSHIYMSFITISFHSSQYSRNRRIHTLVIRTSLALRANLLRILRNYRLAVRVQHCVMPSGTSFRDWSKSLDAGKKVNQSHYRPEVPRGFQEVNVPRFVDNGTGWWLGCQSYALAAFTPRKYSWYSFLLEAESTPRP